MIHDIRFFQPLIGTTAKVFLKIITCLPSAVSHKYIVIQDMRLRFCVLELITENRGF